MTAAVLGAVHLFTRLVALPMPFTHDEAQTVLVYVSGGPAEIYFGTYTANNHVLFSLLAWATTSLLGESESVYRLWGAVPALAAVGWAAWWAARRWGLVASVAFVVLATGAPLLARHSVLARGYGIALLTAVAMLVCSIHHVEKGDRASLVGMGIAGVIGVWAFALMAPILAGHLAAVWIGRVTSRRRVLLLGIACAAALFLVLAPVLPGLLSEARGLADVPSGLDRLGQDESVAAPVQVLRALVPGVSDDAPTAAATLALVALAGLGLVGLLGVDAMVRLAVLTPAAALLIFHLAGGVDFTPRFGVPLFVHVLLPVAVGAALLWRWASRRMAPPARTVPILAAAALVVVLLVQAGLAAQRLSRVPLVAARDVAEAVADTDVGTPVLSDDSDTVMALRYYLNPRIRVADDDALRRRVCGGTGQALVVLHESDPPVERCMRARGAHRRAFRQQWGPPLVLWTVSGTGPGEAAEPLAPLAQREGERTGVPRAPLHQASNG